jgi:hypothetical protein
MKARVYLRIAKMKKTSRNPGYKVQAGVRPSDVPLSTESQWLPTVAFALDLDIPDEKFAEAEQVIAEIVIPEDQAVIAAEVHQ